MGNSKRRSADELIKTLNELLQAHLQQDDECCEDEGEQYLDLRELRQATLPLQAAVVDDALDDQSTPLQARIGVQNSLNTVTNLPWEDLTGIIPKGLNLPMPPALYAKMLWLTNNVPKMSLQKIARAGAEAEADRLIALHYKP